MIKLEILHREPLQTFLNEGLQAGDGEGSEVSYSRPEVFNHPNRIFAKLVAKILIIVHMYD